MITTSRTFTGKDVQEATAAALEALNAELEDVDIRVISPGKPGIFGLGGALAEIEVTVAGAQADPGPDLDEFDDADEPAERGAQERRDRPRRQQQQRPRQQRRPQRQARERGPRQGGDDSRASRQSNRGRQANRPDRGRRDRPERRRERAPREPRVQEYRSWSDQFEPVSDEQPPVSQQPETHEAEPIEELTPETRQQLEEVTSEVLGRLIANMQVQVDAYVLDDLRDGSLVFEIEGEDAGLLIGRRGDTLRDLQSIVRLLVGRRLERRPNIIIDVEQYQDRRRNRLQDLAERAARNATRTGEERLEPMSSDERRLIHIALKEHPNVVTESEGEDDDRHVVVKAR